MTTKTSTRECFQTHLKNSSGLSGTGAAGRRRRAWPAMPLLGLTEPGKPILPSQVIGTIYGDTTGAVPSAAPPGAMPRPDTGTVPPASLATPMAALWGWSGAQAGSGMSLAGPSSWPPLAPAIWPGAGVCGAELECARTAEAIELERARIKTVSKTSEVRS
jgi:hypothetical protein